MKIKNIKPLGKNFIFIIIIFLIVAGVFSLTSQPDVEKEISLTELAQDANKGNIEEITISGNDISVLYKDGVKAKSKKETEIAFSQSLLNYGVAKETLLGINIIPQEKGGFLSWIEPLLFLLIPLLLFGFFFWMILRQAKTGASQALNFSKAKT